MKITRRELYELLHIEGAQHQMTYGLNGRLYGQSYANSYDDRKLTHEELMKRCEVVCVETWRDAKVAGKSEEEQLAETPTGKGSVFYECMHELMRRYKAFYTPIKVQELTSTDERFKKRVEV